MEGNFSFILNYSNTHYLKAAHHMILNLTLSLLVNKYVPFMPNHDTINSHQDYVHIASFINFSFFTQVHIHKYKWLYLVFTRT